MQRRPDIERKTSISYKTEEKTVLRGYNLSDLAEEGYSFTDAMFVLFQNRIPTQKEEKMLRYEMGVFLEHSMSPSAAGAIGVSVGRPNLTSAIAASISTFGGVHGPGAAHGYMMKKYLKQAHEEGKTIDEIAKILVDDYMDNGKPVMGMGQPQHTDSDPRAEPAGGIQRQAFLLDDTYLNVCGDRPCFARDYVSLDVANQALGNLVPFVNAPGPVQARAGGELPLIALASDPDRDELSYAWSITEGAECVAALNDADTATATLLITAECARSQMAARVTVSDGRGGSASEALAISLF